MSFSSLSTELRLEIYSYLVFDTSEPPAEPPIVFIQKSKQGSKGPVYHRNCNANPSPRDIYQHFLNVQSDPVQGRGSMIMEYGTRRACLSTPSEWVDENENVLDAKPECYCKAPDGRKQQCPGPYRIHSLLLTSRWLADEIRDWMYPRLTFHFDWDRAAEFDIFAKNLLPRTKKCIRSLYLCMPIFSQVAIANKGPPISCGMEWGYVISCSVDMFPNLRALHVGLWHQSRRPTISTRLPAPIGDLAWRKYDLGPLLEFRNSPLEEVTVVVVNRWPEGDIWSGDPKISERRELAEWLRNQLLED